MIGLKKWLKCIFEELWMRAKKEKKRLESNNTNPTLKILSTHSLTAMEITPTRAKIILSFFKQITPLCSDAKGGVRIESLVNN